MLFLGEVETTLRLALSGQWNAGWLRAEWDAGANLVWDHEHVAGSTTQEFVGRLLLVVTAGTWGKL